MAAHGLARVEEDVTAVARAIALKRAMILGLLTVILGLAVSQHWITPDWSERVTSYVVTGLGFVATVGAGAWIHQGVTPADVSLNPTSSTGVPLVLDPGLVNSVDGDRVEDYQPSPDLVAATDALHAPDQPSGA